MGLDMEIRVARGENLYMRKANAVRKWFADHLEDFEDNGETVIHKEDMYGLMLDMMTVIKEGGLDKLFERYQKIYCKDNKEERYLDYEVLEQDINEFLEHNFEQFAEAAQNYLPTQSGFFFGDTSYSYWYVIDLFYILTKISLMYMDITDEEWENNEITYWEWY